MEIFLLFVVIVPVLSAATLFYIILQQQAVNWGPLLILGAVIPAISICLAGWFYEGKKKQ